jgi:hypothetical protein
VFLPPEGMAAGDLAESIVSFVAAEYYSTKGTAQGLWWFSPRSVAQGLQNPVTNQPVHTCFVF